MKQSINYCNTVVTQASKIKYAKHLGNFVTRMLDIWNLETLHEHTWCNSHASQSNVDHYWAQLIFPPAPMGGVRITSITVQFSPSFSIVESGCNMSIWLLIRRSCQFLFDFMWLKFKLNIFRQQKDHIISEMKCIFLWLAFR